MARLQIALCVCIFQIVFGQTNLDDTCETANKTVGSCIRIHSCPPYFKVLEKYPTRTEVKDFLRKTLCGFDGVTPKVCCPRQFVQASSAAPPAAPAGRAAPAAPPSADHVAAFPSPPECGFSNASFIRVVGGENAKLGGLPWMALLGYRVRDSLTEWLCGGSLVSRRHVLTAAHCIHERENSLYVVRLGELDLAREDDGATPLDVLIKTIVKHEQYNKVSYENDVGVLVLAHDVQFSALIRPICIPTDNPMRSMDFVDWTPLVAGWGQLSARGDKATHLQVVQLPVLANDECARKYSVYPSQVIDARVLCAGHAAGGKDSCKGDSGGPLMQPYPVNLTSFYYQIGVVSFGPLECARPGLPGIYTRVTSFVPWLQRQVLGAAS